MNLFKNFANQGYLAKTFWIAVPVFVFLLALELVYLATMYDGRCAVPMFPGGDSGGLGFWNSCGFSEWLGLSSTNAFFAGRLFANGLVAVILSVVIGAIIAGILHRSKKTLNY